MRGEVTGGAGVGREAGAGRAVRAVTEGRRPGPQARGRPHGRYLPRTARLSGPYGSPSLPTAYFCSIGNSSSGCRSSEMVGAFDGSEGTFWIFKQKEDLGFPRNHWLTLTECSPHAETRVCCRLDAFEPYMAPQGILLLSQFRVEETEARVSRGGGAGPEWRQPDSGTPTISGYHLQDVTLDGAGETDLRVGGSLAPS